MGLIIVVAVDGIGSIEDVVNIVVGVASPIVNVGVLHTCSLIGVGIIGIDLLVELLHGQLVLELLEGALRW